MEGLVEKIQNEIYNPQSHLISTDMEDSTIDQMAQDGCGNIITESQVWKDFCCRNIIAEKENSEGILVQNYQCGEEILGIFSLWKVMTDKHK